MLELRNVTKVVSGARHISDVSLRLEEGSLNVLLGPTLAGKTSLMRLMAGLDQPTSGTVWMDGANVTGVPVQRRSVAMVYQQFINYPAMTVFENIASPLRVAGTDAETLKRRVGEAADLLRLGPYLNRMPLELSGGQQQRTALARAMVKDARLVLLDEPLANLDYKLREELRAELPRIFAATGAIFVYATTEPSEALLLGGNTATLSQGRVTQFGPTIEVFRRPADLVTAQTFSDPPLNTIKVEKKRGNFMLDATVGLPVPAEYEGLPDGPYEIGFQPHHLSLAKSAGVGTALNARVTVTEITGSESFIHLDYAGNRWVMLEEGVHRLAVDETVQVYIDTRHLLVFEPSGRSAMPARPVAA